VSERLGTPAKLIQRASEIDFTWLDGVKTLGLTAGASAPEILVREVVAALAQHRSITEREITATVEKMIFKLPRQLTE
jgi:4-hydroxy-3-methylbut-2-en-1-yl diphosphate reductase